jgi:hypothetical protein
MSLFKNCFFRYMVFDLDSYITEGDWNKLSLQKKLSKANSLIFNVNLSFNHDAISPKNLAPEIFVSNAMFLYVLLEVFQ